MGFDFANSSMLFGTLLLGVPLLIHLLNRRRYKRKTWAAMSFLLAAYKRTRRRLRLENFLLLLLRCLIVVLLAGAMARPFVPSDSPLAVLSTGPRNVVAVLDDSYSMGYESTPGESCFQDGVTAIRQLVQDLDPERGDTVSVILMGDEPEYCVPLASDPGDALVKLETLVAPSEGGGDFSALASLLAKEVAPSVEGDKEVFIFTDLQTRLLGESLAEEQAGTGALLEEAVNNGISISFVDVSRTERAGSLRPNVSVTDLAPLDRTIAAGSLVTFNATINNYGPDDLNDVSGAFLVDGKVAERRTLEIRGRGRGAVEFSQTFEEAGFHSVTFRLDFDNLALDNSRYISFEARESIDVLLVDGAYDFDPFSRPTGVIGMMLNPARIGGGDGPGTIFNPTTMDYKVFNSGRENLDRFDCIILADVEGLTPVMGEALHDYVWSGGSVVFFMGERVDLGAWNLRLYENESHRLLPARLETILGSDQDSGQTSFYKLTAESYDHPALRVFSDPKLKVLLEVPVFRFVETGALTDGAHVVAWFADALGARYPALIEQRAGRGRILLFTTSADDSWTLIPRSPKTFLPLLHETLFHLTTKDPGACNLSVGETINRALPEFPGRIAVTFPGGEVREVTETVEQKRYGRFVLPLSNHPLDRAGVYHLDVASSVSGQVLHERYAANVDPREGDLEQFDKATLERLFPGVKIDVTDDAVPETGDEEKEAGGADLWRVMLWALLVLVALELFLSWKFGDYA